MPTITETIAADQQAIADAQAVLDAANAQLATDQAKADALAPHLNIWQEVEAEAAKYGAEATAAFAALAARAKALFNL
jgi:hypothetical protein